jgi:nickel transport protein
MVLLLLVAATSIRPALAHKVKCFAAAEGDVVAGFAWMDGGARVRNVPFKVLGPGGALLHEGTTDAKGEFSFAPARACDHQIVVDAGEGHQARFTVRAEELPFAPGKDAPPHAPAADTPSASPRARAEATPSQAAVEEAVGRAVSRAVAPLRRELAEFKERRRLQDIVAGLGYIAGLAGVAFYLLGARRKRRATTCGNDATAGGEDVHTR